METNPKTGGPHTFTCPKCSERISLDDSLFGSFRENVREELSAELKLRESEMASHKEKLDLMSRDLEAQKFSLEASINERATSLVNERIQSVRETIRKNIECETAAQISELENLLKEKSQQLKNANGLRAELVRITTEKEELEQRINLQKEKEFSDKLKTATKELKEIMNGEQALKIQERDKLIDDLRLKLEEATRRAETGSVQIRGKIQETEIYSSLVELFPYDEITKIKSGANGADILHTIKTATGLVAGKIYIESKRTQTWSNEWITKLKKDNLQYNADILMIISAVLPKGMQSYSFVEGVWICGYSDYRDLCSVLRFGIMKVHAVTVMNQDVQNKSMLLISFISSAEFRNMIEAVLIGLKGLRDSHNSEQLRMTREWKQREKLFESIFGNIAGLLGSLSGISGQEIPEIDIFKNTLPKSI